MTGGPKLADDLGGDVVTKMRSSLRVADDDAIEEMNARHFWVRLGKDDVIGREDTANGDVVFQKVRSLCTPNTPIVRRRSAKTPKASRSSSRCSRRGCGTSDSLKLFETQIW